MAEGDAPMARRRWPTGWVTLAGLLIGALAGWRWLEPPQGVAAGLALGVGIDSALNRWLNGNPAQQREERDGHGERAG